MKNNEKIPKTRKESIIALALYCRIPLCEIKTDHPEIVHAAKFFKMSSLSMRLKVEQFHKINVGERYVGGPEPDEMISGVWHESEGNWDEFAWDAHLLEREIWPEESKLLEDGKEVPTDPEKISRNLFRSLILSSYNNRCCITGIDIQEVLVASHIKPWAQSDDKEKMSRCNGLCLNALHDRAFDRGLIVITDTDKLRVKVCDEIKDSCNDGVMEWLVKCDKHIIKYPEKCLDHRRFRNFLTWHRERYWCRGFRE